MAELTADSVIVHAKHVLHTDTGSEILGFDAERGLYFSLEGSGREIWKAAQSPVHVSDVCARLRTIYVIDEANCLQQTLSFIDDLVGRTLLDTFDLERSHA